MRKSIMQDLTADKRCWNCGCSPQERWLEVHHVFGGSDRKHSEKHGLKVYLCYVCHRDNHKGVHGCNTELRERLHKEGQQAYEKHVGTREAFMKTYRKNYL